MLRPGVSTRSQHEQARKPPLIIGVSPVFGNVTNWAGGKEAKGACRTVRAAQRFQRGRGSRGRTRRTRRRSEKREALTWIFVTICRLWRFPIGPGINDSITMLARWARITRTVGMRGTEGGNRERERERERERDRERTHAAECFE